MTTYSSYQECLNKKMECKKVSNPRYKNFKQSIFTAGDSQQFITNTNSKNSNSKEIDMKNNIFNEHIINFSSKFKDLNGTYLKKTFDYMFFKFKKGIYVKIHNNKLDVFLPFSNANFINEWSHKVKYNNNIFEKVSEIDKREYKRNRINRFVKNWYANNNLIRNEFPINETETNIDVIKNMLDELCLNRKLPDIEFFINKRDYPILNEDGTEPYDDIWGDNIKLVSHDYDKYFPILTMSTHSKSADINFPTVEDWARVQQKEDKYFVSTFKTNYDDNFNICWEDKKNTAVFRGTNSGRGITIETNKRLKIVEISENNICDDDGIPFIDAGITKWSSRPRKLKDSEYIKVINPQSFGFKLKHYLTLKEQSEYKYIIHIEGHVSAYRLSIELATYSLILLVESKWKMWFTDLLIPYKHYIPIKEDFSDIIEKIKWCKYNDEKCKQIALNARKFYDFYLSKNSIFDYLQNTFVKLKNHTGHYYYNKPIKLIQFNNQLKLMNKNKYEDLYIEEDINNFKQIQIELQDDKSIVSLSDELDEYKVSKLSYKNIEIVKKECCINNNERKYELTNGCFAGINCLNEIKHFIPNFAFTYLYYIDDKKIVSISEKVEGDTLYQYINSAQFSLKTFINITIQICLTLQYSYDFCKFIHYDLTPWNIILKKTPERVVKYMVDDEIVEIKTDLIPVLIDYDKSHYVYERTHYSNINLFCNKTYQDILTYLTTSLNHILKKKLSNKYEKKILLLSKFISKIVDKDFENINSLKSYIHYSHKFDYLLNLNINSSIKPIDLFQYLITNFKYSIKINYNKYIEISNYKNNETISSLIESILKYEYKDMQSDFSHIKDESIFLEKSNLNILLKNTNIDDFDILKARRFITLILYQRDNDLQENELCILKKWFKDVKDDSVIYTLSKLSKEL